MNDPLVRLSDVIEVVLKAERRDKALSADSVIVDLLVEFKARPPQKPRPKLKLVG